ncbi:hypothetical protein [Roseicyclus mahoneyensis]|jgi:hypothetical protein|uniref:Uncharacterized protein n=1 Tax=Roseicyclus mahoneyensis TaxID=164332 RepID=A0A316GE95_9RHOB|nr:hypothetical protein [Roseicyclus mahoneyensis]PWK59218.1 hypothetical protein C7455_109141 [Roseicyclus mahoneyensis]
MSEIELGRFFEACAGSETMMARYEAMPLPDLIFAARCSGFDIRGQDFGKLVGGMEVWRITVADGEDIAAASKLWRHMWGRSHLAYVVKELWGGMDPEARTALVTGNGSNG